MATSKSTPVMTTQKANNTNNHSSSASKGMVGNLNHNHMPHVGGGSSVGGSSLGDDSSVGRSVGKDPTAGGGNFSNIQDKILFTKIKKGRMSTVDPRKVSGIETDI